MDIYTFLIIIAFFITVIALTSDDNKIKTQVVAALNRLFGNMPDDTDDPDETCD